MALRIWLPLNGNIDNQGLSNYRFNNLNATVDNNGKIGKCYSFDGSTSRVYTTNFNLGENFTMALWAKPSVAPTGSHWLICLNNSAGGGSDVQGGIYFAVGKIYYDAGSQHYFNYTVTADTWYHVALTKQGTTLSFYLNGELIETSTGTSITRTNLTIGARAGNSAGAGTNIVAPFNGCINDVRVYDECLSPKMIKEISKGLVSHYKLTGIGANPNLLVGAYTPTRWTYESCTKINDINPYVIGFLTSAVNQRIYLGVTNVWVSGQKYTYSFDAKASVADAAIDASRSIADFGPTHYLTTDWKHYSGIINSTSTAETGTLSIRGKTNGVTYYIKNVKLERGEVETAWIPNEVDSLYTSLGYDKDIYIDASGNGYNLIKAGSLTFNSDSSRYSGSTVFPGTNTNYLYRPKFDWLKPPFTFSCWCNQASRTAEAGTGTTTLQFLESQGRDCGYAGFSICIANGKPRLYIGTSTSGTYWGVDSAETIDLNTWHMITGTYDGTTARLYVDGVQKVTKDTSDNISWEQANGFTIGKMAYSHTSTANYFPFNGSISDVRLYATALSANDIKELYQTSAFIDNKDSIYAYEFREE